MEELLSTLSQDSGALVLENFQTPFNPRRIEGKHILHYIHQIMVNMLELNYPDDVATKIYQQQYIPTIGKEDLKASIPTQGQLSGNLGISLQDFCLVKDDGLSSLEFFWGGVIAGENHRACQLCEGRVPTSLIPRSFSWGLCRDFFFSLVLEGREIKARISKTTNSLQTG
jgi:hypothetical protein